MPTTSSVSAITHRLSFLHMLVAHALKLLIFMFLYCTPKNLMQEAEEEYREV